ncbi:MAG: GNAT family N-acetyltransferase [bacterium]
MTTTGPTHADDAPLDIRDVPAANRYEARYADSARSPGTTAIASYTLSGNIIRFEHTRVPDVMEGHHVGARLVKFALDDARSRGLRVVAECPFVAAYIARHTEYQDLVM